MIRYTVLTFPILRERTNYNRTVVCDTRCSSGNSDHDADGMADVFQGHSNMTSYLGTRDMLHTPPTLLQQPLAFLKYQCHSRLWDKTLVEVQATSVMEIYTVKRPHNKDHNEGG